MNPYLTARSQPTPMARIDLLLALYDGALERLAKAQKHVRAGDKNAAYPLVNRAQLIVTELAAGVRLDVNAEMGTNYLRLYEFVVHRLKDLRPTNIADAIKILTTMREGFAAIRDEGVAMERRGEMPTADRLQTLCATA
jgi:flagellar secretion chaperone FliS